MSKNKIVLAVVVVVLIAGVAFYSGMKYGQSNSNKAWGNMGQRNGVQVNNSAQKSGANRQLGGTVVGEVLAVDTNRITVKSLDGGSRIVFLSASTTISKMGAGTVKDLAVGTNVSINGASNPDNSVNAQIVQIRPQVPARPQMPIKQ